MWYQVGMKDPQLTLPIDFSPETIYVVRMKEQLASREEEKGDRLSMTFKLKRDLHGKLLAAAAKHGVTVTDPLTLHIDQVLPILQKASPVEVHGYRRDLRTTPKR